MRDLTFVGLRVAVAVAQAGSFTAAAERLGYTQSAISRQVAATERAAGAALFERHGRGVRPTAAGRVLVRHASGLLDGLTAASQELAGLRDRLAGRLAVGGFPTATAVVLPRAVARLVAEHPGLQVKLVQASTPVQLRALRAGRLEVAVLATGAGLPEYDLDGLRCTELHTDRGAGVAVAESNPLSARDHLSPADLADQRWIVGEPSGEGPEFGAWPDAEGRQIVFAARDWPTRLGLVAAGLGIALVPGIAAEAVPRGVRWVPVDSGGPGLRRTVWGVTGPDPGPEATAMVAALTAEVKALT